MRYARIAANAARSAAIGGATLLACVTGLMLSTTADAHAQEVKGSHIEVMVCPRGSQSGIQIQSPLSDSIVVTPTIRVSGAVQSISQIDFYVDDVYNNSLAIGLGETSFASDVSLNPGTHTVKLSAIDSCAQETHTESVVVTYQPQFVPAAGRNADTDLPAVAGSSAAASPAATAAGSSSRGSPPDSGGGISLPLPIERLLDTLGIVPDPPASEGLPAAVKAISAVFGLVLLAGAPILAHTTLLGRALRRFIPTGHYQLIFELAGAILLIIPFVT